MDRDGPGLLQAGDVGQDVLHPGSQQDASCLEGVALRGDHAKRIAVAGDQLHPARAVRHAVAVAGEIGMREPAKLVGGTPIVRDEAVDRLGHAVARLAGVEHDRVRLGACQVQACTEPRGAPTDDREVEAGLAAF